MGLIIPSFLWYVYLELCELGLVGGGANLSLLDYAPNGAAPGGAFCRHRRRISAFISAAVDLGTDDAAFRLAARLRLAFSIGEALFLAFTLFFVLALLINPNATSFFRLYRDRLNKAFVFDPNPANRDGRKDLRGVNLKLHEINTDVCPYPIINAALNLEGSQFANKRGRNADFFLFSKVYCGSVATGYVDSAMLWHEERDLDLATAMAISGAAISANMGRATIKPLVATLALLNVRLGYWLRNPRKISAKSRSARVASQLLDGAKRSFPFAPRGFQSDRRNKRQHLPH